MEVTKQTLNAAVEKQIISTQQADALYQFLLTQPIHPDSERPSEVVSPSFNFTSVLYYLGGLIAIGALTLFMNLGWESFGGAGILAISLVYAVITLKITHSFAAKGLMIPAGICTTFVVCLTPLAIYGLQQWLGFWPDDSVYREYHRYIKWHWIFMELGTLVVGALLLRLYAYPFLVMPIAFTLWYMSMDISAMIAGNHSTWEWNGIVSLYAGLTLIGLAFWVDIRAYRKADYAFWLYIVGVITFWGGLSSQDSDSEIAKLIYCGINLFMIAVGVLIVRRVFVVFGALGCCGYLTHLASSVFENSWLFPIALTLLGLGVIYLGILWQKHEASLTAKMRSIMPTTVRHWLEHKAF